MENNRTVNTKQLKRTKINMYSSSDFSSFKETPPKRKQLQWGLLFFLLKLWIFLFKESQTGPLRACVHSHLTSAEHCSCEVQRPWPQRPESDLEHHNPRHATASAALGGRRFCTSSLTSSSQSQRFALFMAIPIDPSTKPTSSWQAPEIVPPEQREETRRWGDKMLLSMSLICGNHFKSRMKLFGPLLINFSSSLWLGLFHFYPTTEAALRIKIRSHAVLRGSGQRDNILERVWLSRSASSPSQCGLTICH